MREEEAATAIEYGLCAILVAVPIILWSGKAGRNTREMLFVVSKHIGPSTVR